ncbi:MAG: ribosome-associated translation inhibitor RaiA [Acidobacteriia bacterium]|nr:ribosome-associated translation inhibitor RaiA [Terriglobia bacterium]
MFRSYTAINGKPEASTMQIDYTGRQMEITPAIKEHTEEHLAKLKRILGEQIKAHVILTVERHRHIAEITVKARWYAMVGVHETTDMYSSILGALEKIEKQAKKLKAKLKQRKRRAPGLTHITVNVLEREAAKDTGDGMRVIKTRRFAVKPMSIEEAAQEVAATRDEFLVFRNAQSDSVNVIYRRDDGHLGLIEPEH